MAYQLHEINQAIRRDPAAFVQECDFLFQQQIQLAAQKIADNLRRSPIVLLSGPSGSGKTTTAQKIEEALEARGVSTYTVSLDNYFLSVSPLTTPRNKDGSYDFESPACLDMELLDDHFSALSRGEEIRIPKYDFARQMRDTSRCIPLKLQKNEVVVFEGIHALNDDIAGRHPEAMKVYLSARSNILDGDQVVFKGTWMRLTRRAVRDMNFRGSSVAYTLALWANVRRGEKLYISPFKHRADLIFDSALPYEVSVMRQYAVPLFQAVPAENARREELFQLVDAFEKFLPINSELVGRDSLLREFIGGGSYHY